jgi:aspartyl-tRNA(Asn)/glutamyl-tRNA(Gln) amidotransferase subunit A
MKKTFDSLKSLQVALQNEQTTCLEVLNYYLKNTEEKVHLNLNLEVYKDEAQERAKQIDQKIKEGKAGKLAGLVIGLKDVIAYKDHALQASSKMLDGFVSQFDATVVERLLAEDAIIISRQNCDEFAMGSANENSAFGASKNPIDSTRVPGGSSGASAAAVAADMCMVSLGSDTGGSVRQPAAFCGVMGFKPTYSRISRYGLIAYASSFDSIGILAKNVEDIALVLEVIAGKDDFDSTVSAKEVPAYSQNLDLKTKPRIAYLNETIHHPSIQPEIKDAFFDFVGKLKESGHEIEALDFPLLDFVLPTYYTLTTAEVSTNLSRFDGVRYGYRSPNSTDLESMYKNSRSEGFGEEVKKRIILGTFVLSADYYDAYFTKAQKVRRLILEKTKEVFKEYDFIVLPTTPTTAFELGKSRENSIQVYLEDLLTVQASVAGIPAISIPLGKDKQGLPIGLQIMGDSFEESKLFAFANSIV